MSVGTEIFFGQRNVGGTTTNGFLCKETEMVFEHLCYPAFTQTFSNIVSTEFPTSEKKKNVQFLELGRTEAFFD